MRIQWLCLLLAICSHYANGQIIEKIKRGLDDFSNENWQEKIHLHFDKPYYAIGERIWFKVYLVDGFSLKPNAVSTLVHVDLINPEMKIIDSLVINVENGGGAGDFLLADSVYAQLNAGEYTVRAYTNFQKNFDIPFFTKVIDVLPGALLAYEEKLIPAPSPMVKNHTNNTLDVQFFPEGGDLVENITGLVAFKAILKSSGKGVNVEGGIYDDRGKLLTTLKSFHLGMGMFPIRPAKGRSYYALIKQIGTLEEKKYPLPVALEQGYTLSLDNHSQTDIILTLQTNLSNGLDGVVLIGQTRGKVFYEQTFTGEGQVFRGKMSKTGLPPGIAQFTLFAEGIPYCARLIFIDNPRFEVPVEISTGKKIYHRRSPVEITINTAGIASNLSMSITDINLVKYDSTRENIKTNFLLTSDLKGYVENPGYYFLQEQDPKRIRSLDYVMMTNFWRRFTWQKVMHDKSEIPKYLPEVGFNISGVLTDAYDPAKLAKGRVSLTVLPDIFNPAQVITDDSGRFVFMANNFQNPVNIVLQAEKMKVNKKTGKLGKPSKRVTINLNHFVRPPVVKHEFPILTGHRIPKLPLAEYLRENTKIQMLDSGFLMNKSTMVLGEVKVKASKPDPYEEYAAIYGEPSRRLVMDSLGAVALAANNLFDLFQGRVPGAKITGTEISLRGGGEPLFLLDNVPVTKAAILSIPVAMIHHVDFLVSPDNTAIFGSRGANGVVAVFTKRAKNFLGGSQDTRNTLNFKHEGYHRAREFYAPSYESVKPEHNKPDRRITLFWDADVAVDTSGQAVLKFYTSDNVSQYRVEVEGITKDGRLIRAQHSFNTEALPLESNENRSMGGN